MSIEALSWGFKQEIRVPGAKLVLLALCDFADESWSCFPGQETLAAKTSRSERTVRSAPGLAGGPRVHRLQRAVRPRPSYEQPLHHPHTALQHAVVPACGRTRGDGWRTRGRRTRHRRGWRGRPTQSCPPGSACPPRIPRGSSTTSGPRSTGQSTTDTAPAPPGTGPRPTTPDGQAPASTARVNTREPWRGVFPGQTPSGRPLADVSAVTAPLRENSSSGCPRSFGRARRGNRSGKSKSGGRTSGGGGGSGCDGRGSHELDRAASAKPCGPGLPSRG
ncbi:helix-turn-helix domain-containing protein [Streptomyces lasalocidi]